MFLSFLSPSKNTSKKTSSVVPEAIYAHSQFSNTCGGYRLCNGQTIYGTTTQSIEGENNRPVYWNSESNLYIVYSGDATGYGEEYKHLWIFTEEPHNPLSSIYGKSKESDPESQSPVGVAFCDGLVSKIEPINIDIGAKTAKNATNNISNKDHTDSRFTDKDFPPEIQSINGTPGTYCNKEGQNDHAKYDRKDVHWFRATELNLNSKPKLFDGIEPADIMQGSLGDCWLLAALAGIAEYPTFIKDKIFVAGPSGDDRNGVSEDGKYVLRLFDFHNVRFVNVEIDDWIPCRPRKWYEKVASTLFTTPNGNELYVLLLEKAFAKFYGGYNHLSRGNSLVAWMILTGCSEGYGWNFNSQEDGLSHRSVVDDADLGYFSSASAGDDEIDRDKLTNSDRKKSCYFYILPETKSQEEFFEYIKTCVKRYAFLVAAGIDRVGEEYKRKDGLVEGHAFSVLDVAETKLKSGNSVRLIQIRNPWGNDMEWRGKYGDEDKRSWNNLDEDDLKSKNIKGGPFGGDTHDGVFWMEFSEFFKIFDKLEVCCDNMESLSKGGPLNKEISTDFTRQEQFSRKNHKRDLRDTEIPKSCIYCKNNIKPGVDLVCDLGYYALPQDFFHPHCFVCTNCNLEVEGNPDCHPITNALLCRRDICKPLCYVCDKELRLSDEAFAIIRDECALHLNCRACKFCRKADLGSCYTFEDINGKSTIFCCVKCYENDDNRQNLEEIKKKSGVNKEEYDEGKIEKKKKELEKVRKEFMEQMTGLKRDVDYFMKSKPL